MYEEIFKDLKKHATKVIYYEIKGMIPLNDEENKSYEKLKVCYICQKIFTINDDDGNKKYWTNKKSKIIVITPENLEELLILFVI